MTNTPDAKNSVNTLPKQIADEIVRYILDNRLQEGDRLPNEHTLATRLNVGRGTIREAMKTLASRNIIHIRQGSGMYVSGKTGLADDPLGLTFIENKRSLTKDLIDLRFVLEPPIAAWAARNATTQDVREIRALCEEVERMIIAGDDYKEKDIAFHAAIAMSSKNVVVPRLLPIIHAAVSMFIAETHRALDQDTIVAHREITYAIESHDPEAARDAMSIHLSYNRRHITMRWRQEEL
ncbi:MAG: FadR family transcriptional regulator [Methylobacteriaceae bacterium]|jgi:GntR family transcriptional repressor for pyruvate dehydrogenase complex|nr:FadR family transcriptional regulator [Methylobacteriaceae bacterium]